VAATLYLNTLTQRLTPSSCRAATLDLLVVDAFDLRP
jgi:hypothetical protein